ncbi:MAG: YihY/virulence factor BrkB family protein [Thermoleophilia bacterium]|nr:YihY/virulence factor BrkB family protein [Thermoleophilia bacterium]
MPSDVPDQVPPLTAESATPSPGRPVVVPSAEVKAAAALDARKAFYRRFYRHWINRPYRQIVLTEHPAMERFFAERCTHLAGMIAYFGLLSIIPAGFLFISALGFAGYLEAQGWIVNQLTYIMPAGGVKPIVDTVNTLRANTNSLGVIGLVGLIWGTTNFFSCIESGLNIIYGVNNRVFLRQKGLVLILMTVALAFMTVGVIIITVAIPTLQKADRFANSILHFNITDAAISIGVTMVFAFLFFLSCYRFLPNTDVRTRDIWRGALGAAFFFELSVHILPLYLAYNRSGVAIKAFGGILISLIWFYLMSIILLAGGVYNWWRVEKRRRAHEGEPGETEWIGVA